MWISSRTVGRASRTSSVCQRAVISARRSRSSEASSAGGTPTWSSLFEEVRDAAAFEHHAAARDLSGVRGEDGDDADAGRGARVREASACSRLRGGGGECPAYCRAEPFLFNFAHYVGIALPVDEHAGAAAALAVVGFGEIDELEVEGEGAGELVCSRRIFSGGACEARASQASAGGFEITGKFCLAARDAGAAKGFDFFEELVSSLFAENLSEQSAEGANIAAQRRLLGVEVAASSSVRRLVQRSGVQSECILRLCNAERKGADYRAQAGAFCLVDLELHVRGTQQRRGDVVRFAACEEIADDVVGFNGRVLLHVAIHGGGEVGAGLREALAVPVDESGRWRIAVGGCDGDALVDGGVGEGEAVGNDDDFTDGALGRMQIVLRLARTYHLFHMREAYLARE